MKSPDGMGKGWRTARWQRKVRNGLILLCFILLSPAVRAQVEDPFSAKGDWVALDDYAGDKKQASEAIEVPPSVLPADDSSKPTDAAAPKAGPSLEKAAPERPLNYPVMPSSSVEQSVSVSSTTEDNGDLVVKENKDWQGVEAAQNEAEKESEADRLRALTGNKPFAIRFATLPGQSVRSIPADRVAKSRLDHEAASLAAKKKDTPAAQQVKSDVSDKACEALADYRRKQLEEIESDRKTLAQLKSVLSELGLVDRLSFLATPQGLLSQPASVSNADKPAGK